MPPSSALLPSPGNSRDYSILIKKRFFPSWRESLFLLSTGAYLRVITRSKALNPTHFSSARYPLPKSLPSGKGLTFALSGSISGVSPLRNLSCFFGSVSCLNLQLSPHFCDDLARALTAGRLCWAAGRDSFLIIGREGRLRPGGNEQAFD